MRKSALALILLLTVTISCGTSTEAPPANTESMASATPLPGLTLTPFKPESSPTLEPTLTSEPTFTPEPPYPVDGYGPSNFPSDINPLTGLKVANPELLNRRPIIIKVSNLPRNNRPQFGVSLADVVYEYYTEEGTTRFAAIFLGNDAERVGPIRSARLFDIHLIRMYKGIFAFGSADKRVLSRLYNSEFEPRLIFEWTAKCPAMCRFEPSGVNHLVGNTKELSAFITSKNLQDGNGRQNLEGNLFKAQVPDNGQPATQIFVRYSGAIYNRWDYDAATGKYLRYSDTDNATTPETEKFAQLADALTSQPIAVDNLVVIYVTHAYFSVVPEIIDIVLAGPGKAHVFRDGQKYDLQWTRNNLESIPVLYNSDGSLFPLKPGNTWIEVIGSSSELTQVTSGWRFQFKIP